MAEEYKQIAQGLRQGLDPQVAADKIDAHTHALEQQGIIPSFSALADNLSATSSTGALVLHPDAPLLTTSHQSRERRIENEQSLRERIPQELSRYAEAVIGLKDGHFNYFRRVHAYRTDGIGFHESWVPAMWASLNRRGTFTRVFKQPYMWELPRDGKKVPYSFQVEQTAAELKKVEATFGTEEERQSNSLSRPHMQVVFDHGDIQSVKLDCYSTTLRIVNRVGSDTMRQIIKDYLTLPGYEPMSHAVYLTIDLKNLTLLIDRRSDQGMTANHLNISYSPELNMFTENNDLVPPLSNDKFIAFTKAVLELLPFADPSGPAVLDEPSK